MKQSYLSLQRSVFVSALLVALSLSSFGQSGAIKKGDKLYKKGLYLKAAAQYRKAADADTTSTVAFEKLGDALSMYGDFQSAEAVYKIVSDNPKAPHIDVYRYAQLLRTNGKYAEADAAYQRYAKLEPRDERGKEFKDFAQEAEQLSVNTKTYELTSIPENSNISDIAPAYWSDNPVISTNRSSKRKLKRLPFTDGRAGYDLFSLSITDTVVMGPGKIKGKVNGKFNEGGATFSHDGKEMIFTKANYKSKSADGRITLGLYHADWDAKNGWVNITPLPFNNPTYNMAFPSLSKDGKKLFFVSDMPGGQGETDIYVSAKQTNGWGQPSNLGKEINTPGRELSPYIANDGTLYFSSDARVGLGGLDIYSAIVQNGKWGNVVNLGAPVNSTYDDFCYVADETGKNGFMVSNRPGGIGNYDVYKFIKKSESVCGTIADATTKNGVEGVTVTATADNGEKVSTKTNWRGEFCLNLPGNRTYKIDADKGDDYFTYESNINVKSGNIPKLDIQMHQRGGIDLTVDVADKNGAKLQDATVFLVNKATGEVHKQQSDANGTATFDVAPNQQYDVTVVKKGNGKDGVYEKFMKTISTMGFTKSQKIGESASLKFLDSNMVFNLPNVMFDYNSWALRPAAQAELDKLVALMNELPYVDVEMSSHTDSRGSADYNLKLSGLRAQSCVTYLEGKGIDKTRLIAIGFGELKILNQCVDFVPCTEEEHAINRRTEFKILNLE